MMSSKIDDNLYEIYLPSDSDCDITLAGFVSMELNAKGEEVYRPMDADGEQITSNSYDNLIRAAEDVTEFSFTELDPIQEK